MLSEDSPCRVPATMTYIPGSAKKLEQLIGDYDQQRTAKTRNQTWSRFAIRGTDLGSSFEHEGKLYFLFGDTIGTGGGDCLATSDTTDPEAGLSLDFLRENDKQYLRIQPPGISMQGFEVPTGGISANGEVYLFCTTDHSLQHVMGRSVLARFDPRSKRFETVRDVSIRPGNFINIAAHCAPSDLSGLPQANGPQILLWGSGAYRRSHAYLACIAADQIENAQATSYFTGLSDTGLPLWSANESAAAPVVRHPVIGELSVSWCGAEDLADDLQQYPAAWYHVALVAHPMGPVERGNPHFPSLARWRIFQIHACRTANWRGRSPRADCRTWWGPRKDRGRRVRTLYH